jgi:putative tryptophan/tyrosine transport system substrate-binding protein
MRRREFIIGLGSAAVWPGMARAQQPVGIGMLMAMGNKVNAWLSGFTQRLAELGWTKGGNVRMDVRWAAGDPDRARMFI